MNDKDIFYSAGGVVIGPGNKVLIVNQNGNSWSLPKGHLEPGEDEEAAATREIFEESGVQDVHIISKLGEYYRARISNDGTGEDSTHMKHITMFLCVTNQEDLQPIDPENPAAEWVDIKDVADRLTHPRDKEFFRSVTPRILRFISSS